MSRWCTWGGGGGNFGIFISFTVRPVPVPATVTVVTVQWPASAYAAAIKWYQRKVPALDVNFSSDLFVGDGSAQVQSQSRRLPPQHGLRLTTTSPHMF